MKKKFILCSAVLSLMLATPCTAETIVGEPKFLSDGYVSISGKADEKTSQIALKAAKSGESLEYVSIKETTSDDEGNFSFLFRIPEQINGVSSNGTYSVYITGASTKTDFDYVNFEYMLRKIRAAKSGDELYSIFADLADEDKAAIKIMGIAVAELDDKNISSKLNNITDEWFEMCDLKNAEMTEVVTVFNRLVGLEYAKLGDAETALKLINPSYDGTEYNSAANKAELVTVMKYNMAFDSLEKFNESYVLANKIIEFRKLRSAELIEAIQTYDAFFKFSLSDGYSDYAEMNLTKKGKVADDMSRTIGDSTAEVSEIVNAFESAVKAVKGSESTSSGGSSGGSSGSGRGTGTGSYSSGETVNEYQVEKPQNNTERFSDLSDAEWAASAINALADKGIISGDDNGKFNPNNNVTREEFTKMAVLACGMYDENAECDFLDVGRDKWYYRYIASATKKGIITGIGGGKFGTSENISREDMAVIIRRAAAAANISFVQNKAYSEFDDSNLIDEYAKESIKELYCAGIINGVGGNMFAPTENSTRAQAAKIIYQAFVKQQ